MLIQCFNIPQISDENWNKLAEKIRADEGVTSEPTSPPDSKKDIEKKRKRNPDPLMYCIPKEKYNFTSEQERMIEENHNYIFQWLHYHGLDAREYYDVVVFGFLNGIKMWNKNRHKANLKAFLSLNMKDSLCAYKRFMSAERRCALNDYSSFSFEFEKYSSRTCTLEYYLASPYDVSEHLEQRLLLEEILNGDIITQQEKVYCKLLIQGYSPAELSLYILDTYDRLYFKNLKIPVLLSQLYNRRCKARRDIKDMREKLSEYLMKCQV